MLVCMSAVSNRSEWDWAAEGHISNPVSADPWDLEVFQWLGLEGELVSGLMTRLKKNLLLLHRFRCQNASVLLRI